MLNEYQELAARTLSSRKLSDVNLAVLGLGIAGEAGEVADLIKKTVGHGHELNKAKLLEEVGDVLWYCAGLATLLEVDLSQVARDNIEKLRKRYPQGFDPERSRNRSE